MRANSPSWDLTRVISHHFHVGNYEGKLLIGYDIIRGRDLMVHMVITTDCKRQVIQWYGVAEPKKYPSGLLLQQDSTIREIREVFIHTS